MGHFTPRREYPLQVEHVGGVVERMTVSKASRASSGRIVVSFEPSMTIHNLPIVEVHIFLHRVVQQFGDVV